MTIIPELSDPLPHIFTEVKPIGLNQIFTNAGAEPNGGLVGLIHESGHD